MTSRYLMCLATTGLIVACAPMEQAPLVYTSKVLVGAHVEAGTPENPGLAINLGIKGLDAAFVPVAVAKYCASGGQCENTIYQNFLVQGTSEEAIDPSLQAQLESIAAEIAKQESAKLAAENLLVDLGAAAEVSEREKPRLSELQNTVANLEQARLASPTESAGDATTKLVEAKRQLEAVKAMETGTEIRKRIKATRDNLTAIETALQAARGRQVQLQAERQAARKDNKHDAYSVYGSFDGDADGGKDSAGLSLGKVFSTGIAAQNLTQGIREAARPSSKAACLAAVDDAVLAARKAEKHDIAAALEARKPNCLL